MCEQKLLTSWTFDEQKLWSTFSAIEVVLYCIIVGLLTFPAVCTVSAVTLSENIGLFTENYQCLSSATSLLLDTRSGKNRESNEQVATISREVEVAV